MHDPKILIVVLDGVGAPNFDACVSQGAFASVLSAEPFVQGNAVNAAYMPTFYKLCTSNAYRTLLAHGTSVGLPSNDDMGNSEVGHNALGAGRVFAQGAKLVGESFDSGNMFETSGWKTTFCRPELVQGKTTLHLCGLFSDGNVHSHIDHLFGLVRGAKNAGVRKVRLHLLLDGRDVGPATAEIYEAQLAKFLEEIVSAEFDCCVASGGGRTFVTMDRYDSDWRIVERGYNAHVCGEGLQFNSLKEAISAFRSEGKNADQDLPAFVIAKDGKPVGVVNDDDSFVFFNFRGDRALQISRALTEEKFSEFERKRFPKIHFAGMMQYDGDLKIPAQFLVNPPLIQGTMSEKLSALGIKQFACSETQKFGHVTYFWNGNRSGKFNDRLENYVEIVSDLGNFDHRPWMKCAEIADRTISEMNQNSFQIGRINFANGDMVGHTGNFAAAVCSLASTDLQLQRLVEAAKNTNTTLIITADHGNADEMFELAKETKAVVFDKNGVPKQKTSHTLAPVPCVIVSPVAGEVYEFRKDLPMAGLANIASTVFQIAGLQAPDYFAPSLLSLQPPLKKKRSESDVLQNSKKKLTAQFSEKFGVRNFLEEYEIAKASVNFFRTVQSLRSENGCPWDKEQTFESLQKYLIEESYETLEASEKLVIALRENANISENAMEYCGELGDVALQIFLNSQIAMERKLFSVSDVLKSVDEKMLRRHPHVFEGDFAENSSQVLDIWAAIKDKEKSALKDNASKEFDFDRDMPLPNLMKKAKKKKHLPTLNYVSKVSEVACSHGFSWRTLPDVFADLESEVRELREEILTEANEERLTKELTQTFQEKSARRLEKIKDEMGDVVFALSNLVSWFRKSGIEIDLDACARAGASKFLNRFDMMELLFQRETKHPLDEFKAKELTLDAWNSLWKKAKLERYK